jgi:hypothetical protein
MTQRLSGAPEIVAFQKISDECLITTLSPAASLVVLGVTAVQGF